MENKKTDSFRSRYGAKLRHKKDNLTKNEGQVPDKHHQLPAIFAGGIIIKWFREIRSNYWNSTTIVPTAPELPAKPVINRTNPFYYSEGKGKKKKTRREHNHHTNRRRHSFIERQVTPPPIRRRTRTNGFAGHNPAAYLPLAGTMMPSRSTPNLQPAPFAKYRRDADSPPPAPPVRDSSTLKAVKYGPGHEKFPSWPVPAAAETPQALRAPPGGGSTRSKSWTDHTNYPKEKVVAYTRPYMKRQHSNYAQQKLKTVMERCEKLAPESYESRYSPKPRVYHDYPERDFPPTLSQADLEAYARSYQEPLPYLTKTGLEEFMEYTRSYDDDPLFHAKTHDESLLAHLHQKQMSYAQSEGYHSYVSSTDSTSTPFLDRLRRDSEAAARAWEEPQREGRDSVVTTSSGSASSSETLKWHGSMSDVSVTSSSGNLASSRQLIAHSARVQTPQRHHSESVLYMSGEINPDSWKDREMRNNNANKLKLFAVNTYTVQERDQRPQISELERQKYSYLDPDKKHKIPDPTLKAIQKKALLSFYERHQNGTSITTTTTNNSWRSEPQLAPTPQPPPRLKLQLPSRRASSASDYASSTASKRSSLASITPTTPTDHFRHHSTSSPSLGPLLVGTPISVDAWAPARPPKHPLLRAAFPALRAISPDLPPPPPAAEGEIAPCDEPLPPPPPECAPIGLPEIVGVRSSLRTRPGGQIVQQVSSRPYNGGPEQAGGQIVQQVSTRSYNSKTEQTPSQIVQQVSSQRYNDGQEQPNGQIVQQVSSRPYSTSPEHPSGQIVQQVSSRSYSTSPEQPSGQIVQQVSSQRYNGGLEQPNSQIVQQVNSQRYNGGLEQPNGQIVQQVSSQRYNGGPEHPSGQIVQQVNSRSYSTSPEQPSGQIVQQVSSQRYNGGPEHPSGQIVQQVSSRSYSTSPEQPSGQIVQQVSSQRYNGGLEQPNGQIVQPVNSRPYNGVPERPGVPGRAACARYPQTQRLALPGGSVAVSQRINGSEQCRAEPMRARKAVERRGSARESPPPLQPRQGRLNQSMRARRVEPEREGRSHSMSQSKASYLASRRERIVPDAESGSYKRTMSPNGHRPPEVIVEATPLPPSPQKDKLWSLSRPTKGTLINKTNLILRRSSMGEKKPPAPPQEPNQKPTAILPDVLPSGAKLRAPANPNPSPPASPHRTKNAPSKSPPRGSPFSPLRSTLLSNPPLLATCISSTMRKISPPTSPPQIKPSLSPPLKLALRPPAGCSPLAAAAAPESPPQSPKLVEQGLQLIQRTEVVLRVNTSTSDAASQTEKEQGPPTPLPCRKKLQEEIECEKLSEDFVVHLPTADRLKELLVPGPEHKKSTDYVNGLFKVDATLRPRSANSPFRSRNTTPSSSPPPRIGTPVQVATTQTRISGGTNTLTPPTTPGTEPTSPISSSSPYFTTSEPKAKFLTRFSQDVKQCHIVTDTKDLTTKKEQLVNRLDRKLEVLRSEQLVVGDECKINNELGENVEAHIRHLAPSHEADKFRLHIEEVGKITSLLLGLSGRLARAENAIMGMPEDHPERRILECKRDKLLEQLDEAKKLKECIDRRSVNVSNILYKYLNSDEYTDYDHFINMKAKLIMDSKEIAEKIKLGEEQLLALKQTLIVTD